MSEAVDPAGAGEGLTELRRSFGGAVLAPTDEGFDAARRCFNALVESLTARRRTSTQPAPPSATATPHSISA